MLDIGAILQLNMAFIYRLSQKSPISIGAVGAALMYVAIRTDRTKISGAVCDRVKAPDF